MGIDKCGQFALRVPIIHIIKTDEHDANVVAFNTSIKLELRDDY